MKTEIIKRNGSYEVQFTQGVQTFHIPNLEKTKKHAIWQKEMLDKAFENYRIELLASEKEQPVSEQPISAEEIYYFIERKADHLWFSNKVHGAEWTNNPLEAVMSTDKAWIEEIARKFTPFDGGMAYEYEITEHSFFDNLKQEGEELCIILHQGKPLHNKLFDSVLRARNYIKMQYSKRKFKEIRENVFTDTQYGATFEITISDAQLKSGQNSK